MTEQRTAVCIVCRSTWAEIGHGSDAEAQIIDYDNATSTSCTDHGQSCILDHVAFPTAPTERH